MTAKGFHITNQTKGKPPRLPFLEIKEYCLGKDFSVSLVFVGEKKARTLNHRYRGKDYVPDVLSFPLGNKEGEIFICLQATAREAKKFNTVPNKFIQYLFIHGLFHLKGLDHGSTMEKKEKRAKDRFNLAF